MNYNELKEKYKGCILCAKCETGVKVFGTGNLTARVALIGEGPGREEVANGTPFVGPAGQLLDKILASIDLRREDLFLTNAVLCRTDEKNRTPSKIEYSNCRNRLFEELSIVNPRYTLLVGSTALKTVLGENYTIMKEHGKWHTNLSRPSYFYFPMLHPAWILHSSTESETQAKKRIMWDDMKQLKREMETLEKSFSKPHGVPV